MRYTNFFTKRLGVVIALSILGAWCSYAQPADHKLIDFQDIKLANGLRVVTVEDFSTPIVAAHVWYQVGSKDEDPDRQGFAHMFEHMMFRGTERLGPEAHFSLIRKTGGDCNAFTSFDYTAYVNQVPSNQLELALWLEAERMMYLKVDREGFETERKVVEEERRMGVNAPYGTILEQAQPIMFTQHPYKWNPIGNIPMLRAAQVRELQRFWDRWYVPANATLVIVGAVKHENAQALARMYFEWMPGGGMEDRPRYSEPPQTEPRQATLEEPIGPLPVVILAYRGTPYHHDDAIPLDVLATILGGGESSRLNVDLVRNRKLAVQAMALNYGLADDGVVGAGAVMNPGSDPEKLRTALEEHIAALVEKGVTEQELIKAKNQLKRTAVTDHLTVMDKARAIGSATLLTGSPDWLNEQLARIDGVTQDDIMRVARAYLAPERRTLLHVVPNPSKGLPDEESAPLAAPETDEVQREGVKVNVARSASLPEKPPIQPLLDELPQPDTFEQTLANGLRVVVVPNKEVPYVTVLLGLKYGAWAEDPAAPGTASMTMAMLTKGTKNYTAEELAEKIEYNALTLAGNATMDASQVVATSLSDKADLAVELLSEVLLRPRFPEDELRLLQEQRAASLSISEQDIDYIVDRELRRALFGNHPYSRNVDGEFADVGKLSRARLENYWKTYVRPDAAVLYFAGDIEPQSAFNMARKHLGKWKSKGEVPDVQLAEIPKPERVHIYLVDKPGAVQSQIRVAQASITRNDPRYHFARFFTQIYGGAFDSRLNRVIRVERGLTYGAGGGFRPGRFMGQFISSTFTKTETTAETVQALLDVMTSMRTDPPTDGEMESARAYLTGSFPGDLETPQQAADYQWIIDSYGLPKDYLRQAMDAYKKATRDDVRHIAEDVIDLDKVVIVVAGDAAKTKENLEKIAPVTIIPVPAASAEGQEPVQPKSAA